MNFEKHYYFKIDDDEVFFYKLMLDENKNPLPGHEDKMYGFENNPSILDVTSLGYIPTNGSIWDGKTFKLNGIDNIELDPQKTHLACEELTSFSFLLNNRVFASKSICNDAPAVNAIIPAAKSNPEIIYKEVEVN